MPSAATHLHPAALADQQAEDAQHFRRVLHGLIDQGADLARTVHGQATAQAEPESPNDRAAAAMTLPDAAIAFDRLSRAVRRTVALARKVAEPVPVRAEAGSEQKRAAARRRILRDVEDAIQREAEGADVEVLEAELRERLDGPELDEEIDDRPVAEVVADICRDLGVLTLLGNHPWKRRTPPDIAALCARAAAQPRAAPSPVVAHATPGGTEAGAGPPSCPWDAGADLLRFTFPVRGT